MISDKFNTFHDDDLPTGTGDNILDYSIDLGEDPDINLNDVDGLFLVITVTEAVASAGAATCQFRLLTDAQDPIVPASATELASSPEFSKAEMGLGQPVIMPFPKGKTVERYLGVSCVVGTAALTAGKVQATLTRNPPTWKPFKDAAN